MEPGEPKLNADQVIEQEVKIVDGIRFRRTFSGYTMRQYFSHETPDKGPGPGWDTRWDVLRQHGVYDPSELPDEPYYTWEEMMNDEYERESIKQELIDIEDQLTRLKRHYDPEKVNQENLELARKIKEYKDRQLHLLARLNELEQTNDK